MSHLSYEVIRMGEPDAWVASVQGKGQRSILVILDADIDNRPVELAYLEKIAEAVGLSPMAEKLYMLFLPPDTDTALSLVRLRQDLAFERVILFGYPAKTLGIKAAFEPYTWLRLGDLHLLKADTIHTIRTERGAGRKEKALALWNALQVIG